jgi:hypothetical protein
MNKFRIIIIAIFLFSILAVPTTAFARSIDLPVMDDRVIFGGSFTLKTGETLNGSLIILGGVVLLEDGSFVDGDVVVFGGNLTVEGEVDQNLVAIGGVVTLGETAVVYGDLVAPASVFRREEGSQVYGQIITDSGTLDIQIPDVPDVPDVPDLPDIPEIPDVQPTPFTVFDQISYTLTPITNVLITIIRAFAFSTVAIIVVLFIPEHTKRTSDAIVSNPVLAGGLGILSVIIAIPLMIIFIISIVGPILISMILFLGLFLGWIAVGMEVGQRISETISREWSYAIQAGVGTFTMSIVIGSISLVMWDFIAFLLFVGICSIGLGAVLLTRFGTQDYIPADSGQIQSFEPVTKGEETTSPEEKSRPNHKMRAKRKSSTKGKSGQETK